MFQTLKYLGNNRYNYRPKKPKYMNFLRYLEKRTAIIEQPLLTLLFLTRETEWSCDNLKKGRKSI